MLHRTVPEGGSDINFHRLLKWRHCMNWCTFTATTAAVHSVLYSSELRDQKWDVKCCKHENASMNSPAIPPVGYKSHTKACIQLEFWLTQSNSENLRSALTRSPFPSPEEGRRALMYILFAVFLSSFIPLFCFLKSHSLWLLSCAPILAPSHGKEADGSWHDGGIVLTMELMWPRGSCPCMLGLMAKNAKCASSQAKNKLCRALKAGRWEQIWRMSKLLRNRPVPPRSFQV